jgi:hypothetical protein
MILYINGDSHASGFAAGSRLDADDEKVSFGAVLSELLGCDRRINQSLAGGSNPRIIRTATAWIESNSDLLSDTFVLIQWSTWEREEWLHNGGWYQVNASGLSQVPAVLQQRYGQYIIDIDHDDCTIRSHNNIWQFHQYLDSKGIRHLFFNGNSTFSDLAESDRKDWNNCYLEPYVEKMSYDAVMLANGFRYVAKDNGHFGELGHCFWGKHLLQYIKQNQLLELK